MLVGKYIMKKSILALSVLSVLSFGANATVETQGGVDKDVHAKVATFNTAMEKAGNEATITLGENGAYTITFTEHGETQVITLTDKDEAAMKQRMAKQAYDNADSGKSINNANKAIANQGNGNASFTKSIDGDIVLSFDSPISGEARHLNLSEMTKQERKVVKDAIVQHAKDNAPISDPIEGVDPINPIPVTREEAIEYVQSHDVKNGEHFAKAVAYRMNSEDKYELNNEQKLAAVNKQFATVDGKPMFSGVASIDGEIGGVVLINNQTGEQYTQAQVDEMAKDAKAQIVSEAEKRAVTPVDPIYPVDPINPIPVTREEAIEYVQSHDVKNGEHFAKAVAYRMNSEDKYELNNEQKLAAVNKQFATVDGKPMFSGVASIDGEIGGVVLINNQTGEQYTQAQVDEMAKDAKAQVVAEAAKRAEERAPVDLPPVNDPVKPPVIEPDNEKAAQAVKNLVQSGYATSAQMQAQAASINDNAMKIDELFNVTADLREDLELQGARNMAAISARAFTTEEDQFSLGLGLGGSGSENAMAIGGAYQINAEWSVNSTVAFDTGSNVDYGVGVNYTW